MWSTNQLGGHITPANWGVPNASEVQTKSEGAHKWATVAVWGVPNTSQRGTKSEVAHKWA